MNDRLQLQLDAGHVLFWSRALTLQANRCLSRHESSIDAEVDVTIFAFTLRNVVRAAELCKRHAKSDIGKALDEFEQQVPHWREIRNVLEHFDDYERGTGRLQQKGRIGQVLQWYENDGKTYRLNISGKYVLDVSAAWSAGGSLCARVLAALFGEAN